MRRSREIAVGIALAVAGTVVALGLIEGGIRLYRRACPPPGQLFLWTRNAEYGWGLTAGSERISADNYGEFRVPVRINHVHWTPAGHRIAAETATQFLLDRQLVQ